MATNEIYHDADYLALPLPRKGNDPKVNADPTRNGDPVLIGDMVGVAVEVGGVPMSYTIGSTTVTEARNTANSLEPGYASVAFKGAFAFSAAQQAAAIPANTPIGTTIGIKASTSSAAAKIGLVADAADGNFGFLVGWTKDNPKRPIVKIVSSFG